MVLSLLIKLLSLLKMFLLCNNLQYLCVYCSILVALYPIGGSLNTPYFFDTYLSVLMVAIFYVAHELWARNWTCYVRAQDIGIDTVRREHYLDVSKQKFAVEMEMIAAKAFYKRWWHF